MEKENLLVEGQEAGAEILTEGINSEGKKEVDIEVLWQRADAVNSNNRVYPKAILNREIKKINQRIESGKTIWGNAFHPAYAFGKPTEISHKWKKVWMENNGVCKGILSLVDTRAGNDIKALIQAGKLGLSSRGTGTTTTKKGKGGKEYLEVNDDFELTTPGDFVVAPSVEDAGTLDESFRLYESQLSEAGEDKQEIEDRKMENVDILIESYKKAREEEGFKGTFVEYKSLHPELNGSEEERRKLANNLLFKQYEGFKEAGYLKSFETFKAEYGTSTLRRFGLITEAEAKKLKAKRKIKGKRVTSGDILFQAMAAGIDPVEYARKINEQLEREESMSQEERERESRIVREAERASYNRTALAPSSPKDPTRGATAPHKKVRRSALAPSKISFTEEAEPELPKHVFKTKKEVIEAAEEIAKKPLSPELQKRIKAEAMGLKDESLRREREIAGPPRKKSLEEQIQDLGKAIDSLSERLEKLGGK